MLDKSEIVAMTRGIAKTVREYIDSRIASITNRLDEFGLRISSLPPGPKGDRGEKGDSITGPEGPAGRDGKDAVIDYEAIVSDVVALIPTPKDGRDGKDGINGKDGADGRDGIDGKDGQSITGPQGERGRDGRDAIAIDILPAVDFAKSYPRGTFARFDGGLIRSYRDTIPGELFDKSGWEVILAGVAEVRCEMSADCRSFALATRATGQTEAKTTFALPVMIYRGIFDPEQNYTHGDVATWNGSAWHSQVNDNKSEPGKNSDWKLMVKEGRRGKDGKDGDKGDKGDKGDPGRDLTQMAFSGRKY